MENLQQRFAGCCRRMGIGELPRPIFDTAPAALRFRIGGEEKIYLGDHRKPNGAYIENALDRALAIYENLPGTPDILRIDNCPELRLPGLPTPDLRTEDSCYWDLVYKDTGWLRKLFREIIRADLDSAGCEDLIDSVYLLCSPADVLFHLYDDRAADVAAADPALLGPLRQACGQWIPEEAQMRVREMFGE